MSIQIGIIPKGIRSKVVNMGEANTECIDTNVVKALSLLDAVGIDMKRRQLEGRNPPEKLRISLYSPAEMPYRQMQRIAKDALGRAHDAWQQDPKLQIIYARAGEGMAAVEKMAIKYFPR